LRERLNGVDPELRRQRNVERLKLADIKARLRMQDTRRGDPAALHAALEASAARLVALDQRIVEAVAADGVENLEDRARAARACDAEPDPATVSEARAVMRARLLVASSAFEGLLPERAQRVLRSAIEAEVRRLSAK